jgi:hypothetical protein
MSEENKTEEKVEQPAADPAPAEPEKGQEKVVVLTEDKYQELTTSLTGTTAALSEAKKMLDAQAGDITSLKSANDEAVKAYKKLAVSSNPLFTEDVITGATIAEVDASMARVTDLAGKIKTKVEAEIKATIVPAGAPERSGPDTSGLSPREKIKQGLEEKNK